MADSNTFFLTDFTSKTLGTFLLQKSPLLSTSYRGVEEFVDHGSYGVADVVNIKIPGYPAVQTGTSVTPIGITDKVNPYTISDDDIYNVPYEVDIRKIKMQVVGGRVAMMGDPNVHPDNPKEMNPQARTFIDNYVYPAGIALKAAVELALSNKARISAFYTPVDVPSKLTTINAYSDISGVTALMDDLGFMSNRIGVMNVQDSRSVADSLQNMFNEVINKKITEDARVGGPDKGRLAGQDIYTSNAVTVQAESPQFASGTTSFLVTSVGANGTTITFSGVLATAGIVFNAGTMISIPSVNLINQVSKIPLNTRLVITVAADALGDGAGNVTVTLSEPLVVTGLHANVNSLPAASAPAEVFPGHTSNYFYVPMGMIANPIPLGEIVGADNSRYHLEGANLDVTTYVQGLATNGINTFRMSTLCPTLAIPSYIVHLPGAIA